MQKLDFLNIGIETKSIDESGKMLTIKGHAAIFDIPDEPDWRGKDIIRKGAFAKTLTERKGSIKVCFNHDMYNLIGKLNDIYEDEKGLYVDISISSSEDDLQTKIKEGIYNQMSIGYQVMQYEWLDGNEKTDDTRILKEIKLWEVSIVSLPKHPMAIFAEAKSAIERVDKLSEEFDRVIAVERNEEKKYSLMLLKEMAVKSLEPLKALDVTPLDKIDFNKLKLNQND